MKRKTSMLVMVLTLFTLFAAGLRGGTGRSAAAPVATTFDYLPAILMPPVDFSIAAIEVNQAIQKADNSVPLVAGKDTVVRVFAQTLNGSSPGNVTVSLSATRGGTPLGTISAGPMAVPASPDRATYASTFNLSPPPAWLSGTIIVTATVDSAGVVAEASEANNTLQATLAFNAVPDLDVKIVPINYTHQGATNPGFYPAQAVDNISDWIDRTYPVANVAISFRAAYGFTGNLESSGDWSRMLNEVTALRAPDGAPSSQVYYALVPVNNGSQQWFFGGIAGIGWVCCTRASVGLNLGTGDNTGILAAHEIGHNLRRRHAPCGVSTSDPYPYPGASIGEFGLDIQGSAVTLLSPSTYVDMMSYCSPEWISDYTYNGLYGDQIVRGLFVQSNPTPGLMIRVAFDEAGTAQIRPVYAFPQAVTAEPTAAEYALELLDTAGAVIVNHAVDIHIAEEPGVTSRAIHASVPLPARPVAGVRLVKAGEILAQRQLDPEAAAQHNLALIRASGSLSLAWDATDTPALLRYTVDDGQSWTTLGVDVVGGSLQLDPDAVPAAKDARFQVILGDHAGASGR